MKAFPDAVFTYGNITKVDREKLKFPKSHAAFIPVIELPGIPAECLKEGKEVAQIKGISLDKEKSDEHMVPLEKLSTLETVVLMSRVSKERDFYYPGKQLSDGGNPFFVITETDQLPCWERGEDTDWL